MPTKEEMPSTIRRSGDYAQKTWTQVHDSTHEKVGDHWEPKPGGRKGPSDERALDPDAAKRDGGTSTGGVDVVGHTKDELLERARALEVKGRSRMTKQQLGEAIKKANDRATARARQAEAS